MSKTAPTTLLTAPPADGVSVPGARAGGVECRSVFSFDRAREQTLEQFVAGFPSPVLLVFAPEKEAASEQTTSMHVKVKEGSPILSLGLLPRETLDGIRAHVLRKERTRFGEAIWIGRWAKCDISIERATLSRLHAFLTTDADGRTYLGDGGSKNGTYVDGKRVERGESVLLPEDAYLTLGTVTVRFLQPRVFYRELQELFRRRDHESVGAP